VIVNRLWQQHMGRGIVATPNDFGAQGARPTHPELLDYLAAELIRGGWRLRPLHRLMVTSAAYMQGAEQDPGRARRDPSNLLHWRREVRRLEAEAIRDAMLAVSGELDAAMLGPGSLDEGHNRRSVYFTMKRSRLIPILQLFDQPEPLVSVGQRAATTIAPQALALLNNPHVRRYALKFARRLAPELARSPSAAVSQAYLAALSRLPDEIELADATAFVAAQARLHAASNGPKADELALADFCQALFALNEFVYID
jgi:hypothetical protein